MAYWLLKTEPDDYSWNDQVKRGSKGEVWTGVRNFTARRHLKEMKKGDKFFSIIPATRNRSSALAK